MVVAFCFDKPGVYEITLTVTDKQGRRVSDTLICIVLAESVDSDPCHCLVFGCGSSGMLVLALPLVVLTGLRVARYRRWS